MFVGKKVINGCKSDSKTILFTGESGAGKTENMKKLFDYICHFMPLDKLKQRLTSVNPIFEFFGNAKTIYNRNSSRFSKFIQVI